MDSTPELITVLKNIADSLGELVGQVEDLNEAIRDLRQICLTSE
jgi:hypothetical protein